MLSLLRKEINLFLSSLIGYIVISVFLLSVSFFMWIFPGNEFNVLEAGYANIDSLFVIAPWVFMFLVPAITMRAFSEEKKAGTIELLYTKPLTDLQIILAKFGACFLLVIFALLPTLVYFISVYSLGSPVGNIDTGGMWGSYIGLLFLGAGFVAIGIFSSALTDNQIVAFILGLFMCFFVYAGFQSISSLDLFGSIDNLLLNLGISAHFTSMGRGVIDTRDVVYFLSLISVFLLGTKTLMESRKW